MEQKNDFKPLTKDEVLSDAYASYNQDKIKIINNILSKINENNREKAKTLIDDWDQFRYLHSDIYDLEHCFSTADKIEYLEFNSKEEAEEYFSKRNEVINLFFIISKDSEKITMEECIDILQSVSAKQSEDGDLLWDTLYKRDSSFLRMLVQFAK